MRTRHEGEEELSIERSEEEGEKRRRGEEKRRMVNEKRKREIAERQSERRNVQKKMDYKDLRNNKKTEGIDKMNEENVKQKRLALRNGGGKRRAGIESSVDGRILWLVKNLIQFS